MTTQLATTLSGLTQTQRRILEEELKGIHKTTTQLAEAVGCSRATVYSARQSKTYLDAYTREKEILAENIQSIGKHTEKEVKTALTKLKKLVKDSDNSAEYMAYLKTLTDLGKALPETGWDTQAEEIDLDACRQDLTTMMEMAVAGYDIEDLVNYYLNNGVPPSFGEDASLNNGVPPSSLPQLQEDDQEENVIDVELVDEAP